MIGNVRKINAFKHQYNSQQPRLNWQFVIFGHNEHEINVVEGALPGAGYGLPGPS